MLNLCITSLRWTETHMDRNERSLFLSPQSNTFLEIMFSNNSQHNFSVAPFISGFSRHVRFPRNKMKSEWTKR